MPKWKVTYGDATFILLIFSPNFSKFNAKPLILFSSEKMIIYFTSIDDWLNYDHVGI